MIQFILGFMLLVAFLAAAVPVDPPPETYNMTILIDSENLEIKSPKALPKGRGGNLETIESVQDTDWSEEESGIESNKRSDADLSLNIDSSPVGLLERLIIRDANEFIKEIIRRNVEERKDVEPEGDAPYPDDDVDENDDDYTTRRTSKDELSKPSKILSQGTGHEMYDERARYVLDDARDRRVGITPTTETFSVMQLLRRNKRATCPDSPPGEEHCIHCGHETRPDKFPYKDPENGYSCMCDTCGRAWYMVTPCTCTASRKVANQSVCALTVKGETYMPYHNWCRIPFPCISKCPGNLIIIRSCANGENAECGCPATMEFSGPTTCTSRPLCNAGYESVRDHHPANSYPTYTCEECKNGTIQPLDNTPNPCYPPSLTLTVTGSLTTDTDAVTVTHESGDLGTTETTDVYRTSTKRISHRTMDDGSQPTIPHTVVYRPGHRPISSLVVILIVFIIMVGIVGIGCFISKRAQRRSVR